MAKTTNRAGGHQIERAPETVSSQQARPARDSDAAHGAAHPVSRKNPQGGGGGGHGGGGGNGGGK